MSLDIYLTGPEKVETKKCDWCGTTHPCKSRDYLFEANITHNLGTMAEAAGVYNCLWRAQENGFKTAGQLIEPLTIGIALMKSDPKKFEALNSRNGWGLYEHFVPWLEKLLAACKTYADAEIRVSR